MRTLKKTTSQLWETLTNNNSIDKYIEENKEEMIETDLCSYLNLLLESCKYTKSEIFKRGNLQQSYGYHLFAGTKNNPSRNHLLQIAFGMELDLEKTQRLLRVCGLSELYPRNKRDSIIIYCINNGHSLEECFEMLEKNNCDPIYSI